MTDENGKLGLNSAISAAQRAATDPFGDGDGAGEQLPLIPLPAAQDGGSAEGGDCIQPVRKGPGRPPGSRNKRTKDWQEYLLAKYRSPLEVLAETYSRPVAQLARELKCDVADAFRIQLSAAKELAPYVHQRLPQAVEIDGKSLPTIILAAATEVARLEQGGATIDHEGITDLIGGDDDGSGTDCEGEENQ